MNSDQKHRQLTEREIDERVIAEANDDSAWEEPITCFAGAWSEMPEEEFKNFVREIVARRRNAFKRRSNENVE